MELRRLDNGEKDAGVMIELDETEGCHTGIDAVIVAAIVAAFVIGLGVLA